MLDLLFSKEVLAAVRREAEILVWLNPALKNLPVRIMVIFNREDVGLYKLLDATVYRVEDMVRQQVKRAEKWETTYDYAVFSTFAGKWEVVCIDAGSLN